MIEEKKKIILWLSVSIITIIVIIIWGYFLKQKFLSLKIQKKEPTIQELQFKENLKDLKKSLENVKQNISDVKNINQKNVEIQEQKEKTLSSEQIEKIKKEIKKAVKTNNQ
ncbi:hypothetical protein CVV26_00045 [Candidatus Kuenenbacteria bacterium HGW-Kuenenbacteria-1]|uniref:Uncharacterized protein n=1 Tax=Candidatus Kuenenbacteria bacterium HGW-Kuenenbacteria-1 TaxID=2013812 RepID=A0A2N1UP20_9BACT|nr:MAG: hypothetical protein CVV26_00045 [Candidatus Kuenenbacteria bacterium HGW-Kuenenbacteria-1]